MDVVSSFAAILQVFAGDMNAPTAQTFQTLITGWLLAPRRTILGMVRASGSDRHHAAFHRLFATARWSIDQVGLKIFDLLTSRQQTIFLSGDDTLLARCGLKVFGTGMHRDPLLSSRGHHLTRWGHCWVVLCVVFESRHFPGKRFALPVLARLYLNKKSAQKWRRVYHKKTDLMIEMLKLVDKRMAGTDKTLHFLGDSAYTAPAVLNRIPRSIEVTGRICAQARICEPPPARLAGTRGRPRKRGAKLPTPQELLQGNGLKRLTISLYEGTSQRVRIAVMRGRLYNAPDRDVQVVVAEHLTGGRGVEVFYSTVVDGEPEQVLEHYSWRWPIEMTFQDVKQHLGIEEPQNRKPKACERTAVTGFLLYSLIIWWHETACPKPARSLRNWSGKRAASFADILAHLRMKTLGNRMKTNLSTPGLPPGVKKYIQYLSYLIELAA